jgi:hypothetical protein
MDASDDEYRNNTGYLNGESAASPTARRSRVG